MYPLKPDPELGDVMIDRSIGTIEMLGTAQVRFHVSEQNVTGRTDNGSVRMGSARDALVICDISKPAPVCAVQTKEKGRQH